MNKIIPAIIPKMYSDIEKAVRAISGVAPMMQIDITDGAFAGVPSWPFTEGGVVKILPSGMTYEMDLMVEDPLPLAQRCVQAGASRIIFHIETLTDIRGTLAQMRTQFLNSMSRSNLAEMEKMSRFNLDNLDIRQVELALALNIDTPNDTLYPFVSSIDGVQFMGIAEIGSQGQPFDERVLAKIADMHERFSGLLISVDGGVNVETIPRLREAGASRFAVGSAIFGAPDPREALTRLSML